MTPHRTAVLRLSLARLISLTGGEAAYVALVALMYGRTGSALWVSAALIGLIVATGLASPFAGALGDRYDRRLVMIASDLAGAVCYLGLAFATSPALIVVLATLSAIAEAPFFPASSAAIPNLVPDEELAWANSTRSQAANVGRMLGPILGGLLVASVGAQAAFAVNAISFVVSAALAASVRGRFSERRTQDAEHGVAAGFRFIAHDRALRTLVIAWSLLLVGVGGILVAEYPLARLFGTGSVGYGLIVASWALGCILGARAARLAVDRRGELAPLVAGTVLMAVGLGAVAVVPWFAAVLFAMAVGGVGNTLANVAEETLIQRRTPDAVRSRVIAASEAVVMCVLGLSIVGGGAVVAAMGPRPVYLVTGILGLVAAGLLLRLRHEEAGSGRPTGQLADTRT